MTHRIAMWSGPRNLSTAMMRSWENRPDTEVLDEPLYAAYLAATRLDHPGRDEIIAAGQSEYDGAITRCLQHEEAPISYQKHMAHHVLADTDLSWLDQLRNCLLLRDPRRVLASYTKVRETVTLDDIGVPQQLAIADRCELIVDSDDFLSNPAAYQREICRQLDVPTNEGLIAAMLTWPAGPRSSDGVWAPHWYSAVEASTSFGPAPTGPPPPMPARLQAIADDAVEVYEQLRKQRLVLT
jgi:hypothetical protein